MSVPEIHFEALGKGLAIAVGGAHVITSDCLLLADFIKPSPKDKCCDLGTGCGIIPLIWYRDCSPALIHGIELSESALALTEKTVRHNGLQDKIEFFGKDLRETEKLPCEYYDLVTMNPPYKSSEDGKQSPDCDRKNARHETTCTLGEIMSAASHMLRYGGRFALCQRPQRLADVFTEMRLAGIEPKRMQEVISSPSKQAKLVLVEGKKGASAGMILSAPLFLYDENNRLTDEADRIFNAYKNSNSEEIK